MVKDLFALPMGCFEFAVLGALFGDLDFAVLVAELSIYFLLTFGADTFGFTQCRSTPTIASVISAKMSSIIDMVTIRSYLRMSVTVEAVVNSRMAE